MVKRQSGVIIGADGLSRRQRVWLRLLEDHVAGIQPSAAADLAFEFQIEGNIMRAYINNMVRQKEVKSLPKNGVRTRVTFCVDFQCLVPMGITIGQIMKATGQKENHEQRIC